MGKLKFILLCGLGAILVLLLLCYMIRFQKVEDLVSITRSMLASRCGPFKRLLCNPYLLMGAKLHQWLKENKRSGFLRQICLCAHILPTIYDKTLVLAEPWITVLLGFLMKEKEHLALQICIAVLPKGLFWQVLLAIPCSDYSLEPSLWNIVIPSMKKLAEGSPTLWRASWD